MGKGLRQKEPVLCLEESWTTAFWETEGRRA